jgi:hypothetical protein
MALYYQSLSGCVMERDRIWILATATLILGTMVLSGPLVSGIDLTPAPESPQFGDGNVEVRNMVLPANATLVAPRLGAGKYPLRVPPATMELVTVSGSPRLAYIIEIPDLNYTRSTTTTVTASQEGSFELILEESRLPPDKVSEPQYRGKLTVERWSNGTFRELGRRNISVQVQDE